MECSDTFIEMPGIEPAVHSRLPSRNGILSRAAASRAGRRSGLTLIELLVALSAGSILMLALATLVFYTGRSFAALGNYVELDSYSRNALDQMLKKIRQSDELIEFQTNKLTLIYNGTNRLTYYYSPSAKTLTETLDGTDKVLLSGCDALTFSIFQRNTAAGTYDQFPATLTNSAAKLVQVSWTCSRSVLKAQINTESVQSAKIVIRNQ
jgi:prepilin-type N-terminal cleavage/methylation domain-containing protein